jgi:hypothetical protein
MINSVDAQSSSLSSMLELFESRERPRIMDARFALDWNAETEILSDLAPRQVLRLFRIMQESVT